MKFLMIVLVIRLVGELIGNYQKNNRQENTDRVDRPGKAVEHPAEFRTR